MKKILVAGGAGYIGSACSEYLLDMGYEVTVLDALFTGHRDAVDSRAEFIHADLADREKLFAICRKGGFDDCAGIAADFITAQNYGAYQKGRKTKYFSEVSTSVVPTSTGRFSPVSSTILFMTASYFAFLVLYMRSFWSSRAIGLLVGITTTSSL